MIQTLDRETWLPVTPSIREGGCSDALPRLAAERSRLEALDSFQGIARIPITLNKYVYASSNPITGSDPSGLLDFSYIGQLAQIGIQAFIRAARAAPLIAARAGAKILTQARTIASYANKARRFFYDARTFDKIRRVYWSSHGPAAGRSLHHWLIPQRWSFIPQGIRNAGFNLLELPKLLPGRLGLNQWMGFALNWGGYRAVVAVTVENGIRVAIPAFVTGLPTAGYLAGKWLDKELNGEEIDLGDGAVAVPLDLDSYDIIEMQESVLQDIEDDPGLRN